VDDVILFLANKFSEWIFMVCSTSQNTFIIFQASVNFLHQLFFCFFFVDCIKEVVFSSVPFYCLVAVLWKICKYVFKYVVGLSVNTVIQK